MLDDAFIPWENYYNYNKKIFLWETTWGYSVSPMWTSWTPGSV